MTATSQEEETAILDAVGKWLERDVRPHVHALEHDDIDVRIALVSNRIVI